MPITLFEHNVQLYSDFETLLKEKHKAMVVSATGTGKTSIVLKYLEDHDFHGLVVCPQKSICRQWESLSTRVDAITYQKLMNHPDINSYDCFIFDEAHHTGAEKWGISVKEVMSSTTKPVIGLTADPKRYLDNARDMGAELWDGNVVYGVDLDEAIQKRILPGGSYICALFDSGLELKKYMNIPMTDTLRSRLEMSLKNCQTITQILHKHMPPGNRKGIVFVDSIKSITEGVDVIKQAYPSESVMCIHSEQTDSENAKIINAFKSIEHGFIVTVNMFNEGIHMSEINTIIMLRRTLSPNLFMQQLGRGFTPNSTNVVIYDFVANSRNLNAISTYTKRISGIPASNEDKNRIQHQLPQLIVYDYASSILSTIKDIKKFLNGSWTAEEDDIIRKYYQIEKGKIINRLPGRTLCSCRDRAAILNVQTKTSNWTPEEDDIIRKYYQAEGSKIINRLPGRTLCACRERASMLGLCTKHIAWTHEEDDILRKYYPIEKTKVAVRLPGKNRISCRQRARVLGLQGESGKTWTADEDNILRQYFSTETYDEIANRLPGRTPTACSTRAYNLGLKTSVKFWTSEEDAILRKYYPIEGGAVINRLPGRETSACRSRADKLGLRIKTNDWSTEEDDIIKQYYPTEGYKIASRLPGRTPKACKSRAAILGIQSNSVRVKWTAEEDDILRKYYPNEGLYVANRLPERTEKSCYARVCRLGLNSLV